MVSLVGCLLPRTVEQVRGLRTPPVATPRNLARLPHAAAATLAEPVADVEDRVRGRLRGWRARVARRARATSGPSRPSAAACARSATSCST